MVPHPYWWRDISFPDNGKRLYEIKGGQFFYYSGYGWIRLPWAVVRNQKFVTENLTLAGNIELNRIVQEMKDSDAFGESALDAIDIPIEIG